MKDHVASTEVHGRPVGTRHTHDGHLSRGRLISLCVLAAIELAMACAVVQLLVYSANSDTTSSPPAPVTMDHSTHHGARSAPAETATVAPPSVMIAGLVAVCLIAIVLVGPIRKATAGARPRENATTLSAVFGLTILVTAFLPAVRSVAAQSHVAMMGQLMIVMVAAPAVLAYAFAPYISGRPSVQTLWFGALPAALIYSALMIAWHITSLASYTAVTASFLVGFALWIGVFTDTRASADRLRTVTAVAMAAPGGLLGLAFLISSKPLMVAAHQHISIDAVTDQRLGGLLMMAVEAAFLVPVFTKRAAEFRSSPSPSATR
ncbi:cytochrome c oxidase assembly protein [Rhodococcus erythropolis]|uniref:cytochrome c oxidase assembly protein n=1 Tax=Rhodococcus erythropolis TaxID=1833 RepID=UPI0022260A53|nr:cytochrome c oxidase assembly protein [Rhodococcus erythropolis]MCW2295469.1 hypothetical protein [Rhodococcus erythropolis]